MRGSREQLWRWGVYFLDDTVGSCFPPLFLKHIKGKIKNALAVTGKETSLVLAHGRFLAAPVGWQLVRIIAGLFVRRNVATIINQTSTGC